MPFKTWTNLAWKTAAVVTVKQGDSDYDLGARFSNRQAAGEGFSDLFLTDGRIPAGKSVVIDKSLFSGLLPQWE